jgi:isocitrate/isopropylmalate dehydrogenase
MFEPVHGSAPPLAGRNVANPIGAILSAALMLETLGRTDDARRIERAVEAAVQAGETTRDVGGTLGTREAGEAILRRLS